MWIPDLFAGVWKLMCLELPVSIRHPWDPNNLVKPIDIRIEIQSHEN